MPNQYIRCLTIAGSDSGGGAGIQADLKTFTALGVYGMSVITALTAQNTLKINKMTIVDDAMVGEQMEAIFQDIGVDGVKIGMLYSRDNIRKVSEKLRKYKPSFTVLDPIMLSKEGSSFLEEKAVETLMQELWPLATVCTPNIPEAQVLLQREITNEREMEKAALDLLQYGAEAVLLKGGHLPIHEMSVDCLALGVKGIDPQIIWYKKRYLSTRNTHGTGCTLSSAIAAFLSQGDSLTIAVDKAKSFVSEAIEAGAQYRLGRGHGPLHHSYRSCPLTQVYP